MVSPTRGGEVLRIRAAEFRAGLRPSTPGHVRLHLGAHRSLKAGTEVAVEVSLGALADEVTLHGVVVHADESNDARGVVLEIETAGPLDYLCSVLEGAQTARARAHRRLPSRLAVQWSDQHAAFRSELRDISRGGAFIALPSELRRQSDVPRIGARVDVTLWTEDQQKLRVPSVVSWVAEGSAGRERAGFGVHFRPADRQTAQRLSDVVRSHETLTA